MSFRKTNSIKVYHRGTENQINLYRIMYIIFWCLILMTDGYTVGRLTAPSGVIDDTLVINYGNDKVSATARIHAEPGEAVTIYHDDGTRETVLPTSVVARHVLQNLQVEIINAEFAGNLVRLKNLAELQTEWSWIRRDLLRSEVEQKLGFRTLSKTYVPKGTHKWAIEENASSDSIVRPAAGALALYDKMNRDAHAKSLETTTAPMSVESVRINSITEDSRAQTKGEPSIDFHQPKISYDQLIKILVVLDLILLCILITLLCIEPTVVVGCFNCTWGSKPYRRL